MARPYAAPQRHKSMGFPTQPEEEINLLTAQINGGINTYIDAADITDAQVQIAKNMRISGDRIFRRDGTVTIDAAAPDTDLILDFILFNRFVGDSIYYRFTGQKIYRKNGTMWEEVTGSGYTIPYRPHTLAMNDRLFFATGQDEIQEIDVANDTYANLGNAPKYKYIAGFFNRIVGANLYDASSPNPIQIGRSGDLNFAEWDPSVDISAGFDSLVEGEGDFNDNITGLIGFASVLLVFRERSLWTVTKRASASAPFIYTAAFPNVGCDSPDSIAQTKNGAMWYDSRSNQVYKYEVGGQPEPIGTGVRRDLKRIITDNLIIQGAYDPVYDRYHLTIPSALTDTTIVYVYDNETNSWVFDERQRTYGTYPLDTAISGTKMDDLVGPMDMLLGDMDDLSDLLTVAAGIYYGQTDGEITVESMVDDDAGDEFVGQLDSKIFVLNPDNMSVSRILLKYVPFRNSSFDVYFSRNGGNTYELYKTIDTQDIGVRKISTFPRNITTSEFAWRIIFNSGSVSLNEYRIQAVSSTQTRAK